MDKQNCLYLSPNCAETALAQVRDQRVLTPNPRAARALGVRALSLEELATRQLARDGWGMVDELLVPGLLTEVAASLKMADPAGTARRLMPMIPEVLRAGLNLNDLAAHNEPRIQSVANVIRGYVARLRALRRYDRAEIYWMALAGTIEAQTVLVTGYPRLGRDEEAFLLALAAPGSALVLPWGAHDAYQENDWLATRLMQAGWTVARANDQLPPVPVRGWEFADKEAEVRAVLAQVKELLMGGTPAREVAIVARDDRKHGPMVLAIASEYGIPVRAEYQIPLSETRFGYWMGLLTDVVASDLPFEPTYRLLGHTLCQALTPDERIKARTGHPNGSKAWLAISMATDALVWPEHAPPDEWIARLRHTLTALGITRRVARRPVEAIATKRFWRALDSLKSLAPNSRSRDQFLHDLRDILGLLTTPAHPAKRGVGLHTPFALFGARYRHLFVIGTAEDELPARLNDDPVLDFMTRKRLVAAGFPIETATAAARRERLTFDSLLGVATESLTFSFARVDQNRARLPSPAFGWLGIVPESPEPAVASPEEGRRIKILGHVPDEDPLLQAAHAALMVERHREEPGSHAVPNPHDGGTGIPIAWRQKIFSASQLTTLGQCPFKWYVQRILRVEEPPERIDESDPLVRGQLYHKTLELACQAAKGTEDFRKGVLDALDATIREAEIALAEVIGYNLADMPGWDAAREMHLVTLRRAVKHKDFLDADATVVSTEATFEGVWREFQVRGQVDRIDVVDDQLLILDYKAGSSIYGKAQDANRKNKIDLQLPIYTETAAPALYPHRSVGAAAYYTLKKPKRHDAKTDDTALDDLLTRMKTQLDTGHFPVAPDIKRESCAFCPHTPVCRAGTRLGRKEA